MSELGGANGVRGHAERLRLEPGRPAKTELQGCEQCLPHSVPHGRHEERAGQTGEGVQVQVPGLPVRRGSPPPGMDLGAEH